MSAPLLTITAYGLPAPQGSKRHLGRGVMVESSKNVKPWREAVKAAALEVRGPGWTPLDAPLAVSMVFTMPKPASAPKRRRTWPMRTPDLSKLIRSTEDALTDAGIWRDDARVVRYHDTGKAYPGEDDLALTSPGVVIRIWPLEQLDAVPSNPLYDPTCHRDLPIPGAGCGRDRSTCRYPECTFPDLARPAVAPYLPAAATPEGIEDIALPGLEAAR